MQVAVADHSIRTTLIFNWQPNKKQNSTTIQIFSKGLKWVFRGSNISSREYFVGPKVFLVSISWVQNFFLLQFRGSKFFLLGISWVQHFMTCNKLQLKKKKHMVEGFQPRVLGKWLLQLTLANQCLCKTDTTDYDLTGSICSNLVIHM